MFDINSTINYFWIISLIAVVGPLLIAGFVVWKIFQSNSERNKVLQVGIPAEATILRVRETGVYINNQPQIAILVEVRPASTIPFQTEIRQIISQIQIPQFQPGTHVAVRYDPSNLSKVAIAGFLSRAC